MSTMHPVTRSRALQSGLVGAGLLGALGISLGLASSTQASTHSTPAHGGGSQGRTHHTSSGHRSSRRATHSSTSTRTSPKPRVTAPKPTPTQATSSGS